LAIIMLTSACGEGMNPLEIERYEYGGAS